jgi:undecaprenyl diphosphate synthase
MDGNGRWAEKRSLNRIAGHQKGIKRAKEVIRTSREIGIEVLTLYAFSTIEDLPKEVTEILQEVMYKTKDNTGMILNTALSYSGRSEIIQAVKKIASDIKQGKVTLQQIDETIFSKYLFTSGLPDPDFLIRTSGEHRISNFLLWQMAYTELYITDTLWPDFTGKDLIRALEDYQKRERRFGLTRQQIK